MMGYKLTLGAFGAGISCVHNTGRSICVIGISYSTRVLEFMKNC